MDSFWEIYLFVGMFLLIGIILMLDNLSTTLYDAVKQAIEETKFSEDDFDDNSWMANPQFAMLIFSIFIVLAWPIAILIIIKLFNNNND